MTKTKDYFYKYYTADSAIKTLKNCSRKWSNPIEFNDPFDCQTDIDFIGTDEEVENATIDNIIRLINANSPMIMNDLKLIKQFKRLKTKEEQKRHVQKVIRNRRTFPGAKKLSENYNNYLKDILLDLSIFCLTETKNNLLMWSHYAENHKGAVIKFKNDLEEESLLKLAVKVNYDDNRPEVSLAEVMDDNLDRKKDVINAYIFTKGKPWEYEKEWRIIKGLEYKTKTIEYIDFNPEEIADVYLGCRIEPNRKDDIIKIVKNKYPWAGIYQADKSKEKYELIFEQI